MNFKNVLVTGGAGFIGSHIVDKLVKQGYNVVVLDNLTDLIHQGRPPKYLNSKAKFIKGDITSKNDLKYALVGIDAIYHEAAVVGVGQSMYEIEKYVYNNSLGTARLLDFLANNKNCVKRLIVASSMSAYGEGLYKCGNCGPVRPPLRTDEQMRQGDWELYCPNCHSKLTPIGIPETEKFACNSVYAITKQSQEDMVMVFGKAYGLPVTAFRFFNVYGPRQSLSNPYTGVAAIFLSRLKNNKSPVIYEDGLQSRDFISVYDIADANVVALENPRSFYQVFNLGTGKAITIKEIALTLAKLLGKDIKPQITKEFRSGDVRHCFSDISHIKSLLSWGPTYTFEQGMIDLIRWGKKEHATDLFEQANRQLKSKGLLKT